ncbi:phage integrase central domain-containing protein [Ancylobacter terrae]|uniref:phage integrase central domain-containing protein n=1 Tax=Ancylobacter sp. sgz301288 TaxID=3342077 RepID=UPI00385F91CD
MADGVDPGAKAKVEKLARKVATGNTFGPIADEYVERLESEDRAPPTIEKVRWLLSFAPCRALGKRPTSEISAAQVLAVLRAVE